MSARETEVGSLWKVEAVRRAACFCAQVVPWEGVVEEGSVKVVVVAG